MGSIPGQGTKIPHAIQRGQKKKKKKGKTQMEKQAETEIQLKLEKRNYH